MHFTKIVETPYSVAVAVAAAEEQRRVREEWAAFVQRSEDRWRVGGARKRGGGGDRVTDTPVSSTISLLTIL